jgi:lipoprotein-releasing system permease protein
MSPSLYIALRFLTHRKRALLLSLSGVIFGVAFFICTQAQTQGFAKYFINSTLGSNGALIVRSRFQPRPGIDLVPAKTAKGNAAHRQYFEGVRNPNEIMRVSRRFSNVVSCSPVLRGTLSARSGFENATVDLFGIEPALHLQTTNLGQQLIAGNFDDFRNKPNSVIVGSRLAELLNVDVGDTLQLLSPGAEYRRCLAAAIAHSGVGSGDSTRMSCPARVAEGLLPQP